MGYIDKICMLLFSLHSITFFFRRYFWLQSAHAVNIPFNVLHRFQIYYLNTDFFFLFESHFYWMALFFVDFFAVDEDEECGVASFENSLRLQQ